MIYKFLKILYINLMWYQKFYTTKYWYNIFKKKPTNLTLTNVR